MLHPLKENQYKNARHLFQLLEHKQPMCLSVFEGIYPGKVFVDDIEHPDVALLTTFIESEAHGVWAFLAGNPENPEFNQSLSRAISDRQIIPREAPLVLFTCDSPSWDAHIPTVETPSRLLRFLRWHFISREEKFLWRDSLPKGYRVKQMNSELRNIPDLEIPVDVRTTLDKWASISDHRFRDFGFVIVDETGKIPVIACWATVDFIAQGFGDLGFFTQDNYRRRGFGTFVAAAALEYGLTNGLTKVNWTCDADNQGSLRIAQKLGLERIEDYMMYVLIFDQ
jgi:RimJ/RimL family protein N-acetyltransferase